VPFFDLSPRPPLPQGEGEEERREQSVQPFPLAFRERGRQGRGMASGVVKLQFLSDGKLRQARELRARMTPAEVVLWEQLRCKQLGVKFRRQQVIAGFIADFYCEAAKLIIEVDGSIHTTPERMKIDALRRDVFAARGLREIRFTNKQVQEETALVLEQIQVILDENRNGCGGDCVLRLTSPPAPSPAERGGTTGKT